MGTSDVPAHSSIAIALLPVVSFALRKFLQPPRSGGLHRGFIDRWRHVAPMPAAQQPGPGKRGQQERAQCRAFAGGGYHDSCGFAGFCRCWPVRYPRRSRSGGVAPYPFRAWSRAFSCFRWQRCLASTIPQPCGQPQRRPSLRWRVLKPLIAAAVQETGSLRRSWASHARSDRPWSCSHGCRHGITMPLARGRQRL